MKTYTFIAAIALSLLLTSCSTDGDETTYTKPKQAKNFDSLNTFAREADSSSASAGEPSKPKSKD